MRRLTSLLITLIFVLSGCAGTTAAVKSEYRLAQGEKVTFKVTAPENLTEEARGIFISRLTEKLTSSGLLTSDADANAREIDIQIMYYRMRHGATRAMLGVIAGSDNMHSVVKVKNKSTGEVLSEYTIDSNNATAMGTSRGMIRDHADKIIETLIAPKK
ncbi:DUF4410 domain-containing protein [Parvibium lacunae]|uniref:DUF4410 domain-containing protein n=1 Tax=Parvibium lacunae TaxID=1888893 RepID=A0A368L3S7_9BURK|nr:DUF4410 domain-containing protein [Parvibium lacunae]RCS58072.1 hypothetical protein DU000_04320 [Parvibium lacunae]